MRTVAERLAAKTVRDGDCLLFAGAGNGRGYGMLKVDGKARNVSLVRGKYRVSVKHDGRNHWGGSFDTLEEAATRAIEFRREVFA